MSLAATVISFGEWLPDLPALNNPGLVEAKNVVPRSGAYVPFAPLDEGINYPTTPGLPYGGIWGYDYLNFKLYMGDRTSLRIIDPGGTTWTNISAAGGYSLTAQTHGWSFTQFERTIIAATPSQRLQRHTLGAGGNFTLLSTAGEAPYSDYVGRIGQFVIAVNNRQTTTASVDVSVRWSAIGDHTNWPTPNSATAIATQSGEQFLDESDGPGYGVNGGDQFGVIFQETALTRMTYVGPPVVFQFDKYSNEIGCVYPNSIVHLNGKFYFIGRNGVYMTDGVGVTSLSAGKIDRWLFDSASAQSISGIVDRNRVTGAVDVTRRVIEWGYSTGGSTPSIILIYNYEENRFSWASQAHEFLLTVPSSNTLDQYGRITGFDPNNGYVPGFFVEHYNGFGAGTTPGIALLTTGEMEPNPGGRTYVDAVKPNVEATSTPSVAVRVGYRDSLSTSPTYTATTTPLTRTGFANFRVDAKYVQAEVQITGNFLRTTGAEYCAKPSSAV